MATQRSKARAFMKAEGYGTAGAVGITTDTPDSDCYCSDADENIVYDSPNLGDDGLVVGSSRYSSAGDKRVRSAIERHDEDCPTPNNGRDIDVDAVPGNSIDQNWKSAGMTGGYRRRK